MLREGDIKLLLNQNETDDESPVAVTYDRIGPAELDPWLLLGKRKNIWLHTTLASAATDKQQIIFCAAMASDPVTPFFLLLMASLLRHREVIIWPGVTSPLYEAVPVSSPEMFWEKLPGLQQASRAMVKASLAEQGLSADKYFILDHAAYCEIISRWCQHETLKEQHVLFSDSENERLKQQSVHSLDLTSIDLDTLPELAPCLESEQVHTVRASANAFTNPTYSIGVSTS